MEREDIHRHYSRQFKTGRVVDNSVPDSWLSAISSLFANVDVLIQGELREGFHWLDINQGEARDAVGVLCGSERTDGSD